jgi:hypothetical protein
MKGKTFHSLEDIFVLYAFLSKYAKALNYIIMRDIKIDATGEPMQDYDDVKQLGHSQLSERAVNCIQNADDFFFDGDNIAAGYAILVAEKYIQAIKNNIIHSAV